MRHLTRTEFRHEPDDKQRWFDAADACGISLSEFIRAALDSACNGTALPKRTSAVTATCMDPVAFAHLRGACNNLNQVVHSGHLVQSMDAARIAALAEEIKTALLTELAKIAAE
ncbi:MAG: hypothetical protein ACKVP7_17245 [Hyphomicrobiaceae bacterium]